MHPIPEVRTVRSRVGLVGKNPRWSVMWDSDISDALDHMLSRGTIVSNAIWRPYASFSLIRCPILRQRF